MNAAARHQKIILGLKFLDYEYKINLICIRGIFCEIRVEHLVYYRTDFFPNTDQMMKLLSETLQSSFQGEKPPKLVMNGRRKYETQLQ